MFIRSLNDNRFRRFNHNGATDADCIALRGIQRTNHSLILSPNHLNYFNATKDVTIGNQAYKATTSTTQGMQSSVLLSQHQPL